MPNRGEVWLAILDPKRGTEPGKTRPVLNVQAQALLDADHPSTLIIPLTTNLVNDAEPLRLRVIGKDRLRQDSEDASPLRLSPAYLGTSAIEEVIQTVRGRRMLWLEILVNDQLDLTPWQSEPAVQLAYQTACRWYTQYRRLLTALIERAPLPVDTGPIDFRDYRVFAEALSFVCDHACPSVDLLAEHRLSSPKSDRVWRQGSTHAFEGSSWPSHC